MPDRGVRSRVRRHIPDQAPLIICLALLALAAPLGLSERTVNPYWIWICLGAAGISGAVWLYNLRRIQCWHTHLVCKIVAIVGLLAVPLLLFGLELTSVSESPTTPARPSVEDTVAAESGPHTPEPTPVAEALASEPAQPESTAALPREQHPPAPTEAPVVADGAKITQETSGDSSHNIIAREVVIEQGLTKPRTIPMEQRTRLIDALKRGPKGPVKLACVLGDVEGNAFADQIRKALDASGWPDCDPSQRVYVGGNPVGFGVVVRDAENPPPHAAVLQQAFESVGITCGGAEDPDVPESVVEVLVGTQP
jgi:hypothetical protein